MTEKNIVIEGNENIDNEVIYSIIGNKVTVSTEDDINEIIKTLFDTGNFKSIETEVTDKSIIIKIVENPKIRKIRL
jgi:Outer membrane protein/protective antigen OMA87